jgi:nucleoside-diphosphate-sugar epimerase
VLTGDVTHRADVDQMLQGCNAVIHAAGLFSDDHRQAEAMRHINVTGTEILLEASATAAIESIVYVSSYLALFPPRGALLRTNNPVGEPKNVYARTKADAERVARAWQDRELPLTIIYPGAVHGPHDPTFSVGPAMIARYVREGVLVTDGGLVYTDVRDLAKVCAGALARRGPARYMLGGFYLGHEHLLEILRELTAREIPRRYIPGPILRLIGRVGDSLALLRGKTPQLTWEAATVLTRTIPCDDQPTLQTFNIEPIAPHDSFRDLLLWMYRTGKLGREDIGKLADLDDK